MNILYKQIYFLLYIVSLLFAVSAPPFPLEIKQSDGSKIPVRMYGDEYYNWMETEEGYVIKLIDDGVRKDWHYCILNAEGKFISSDIIVTHPAPSNLDIPKQLRETIPKVRNSFYKSGNINEAHNTYLQRNSSENTLKPLVFLVEFSDESQIYEWQINPNTRKYSENTAAPTPDEHHQWFMKKMNSEKCVQTIIQCNERDVGVLRFEKNTDNNNNTFTVAIYLDQKEYGKGIGTQALLCGKNLFPRKNLLAKIMDKNIASKKIFVKAGFFQISPEFYKSSAI